MSSIAQQVHGKFKVFVGQPDAKGLIDELASKVSAWVRTAKVAPKSIGVEYLESAKQVVLTIGYRDDEPSYDVQLRLVPMGRIETLDDKGVARLERTLTEATAKIPNIICHELYVTETNDFHMVFMLYQQK